MKKLMIAAAIAFATAVSQAATSAWNVDWMVYDTTLPNGTAYAFNAGNTASTLAAYLTSGNYADDSAFQAALSSAGGVSASVASGYGYSTNSQNAESNPYTALSFLVIENTVEGNNVYWADDIATAGYVYNPPNQGTPLMVMSFQSAEIKYGGDVPEPTSAMLVLLGVAGLALKRRRA